MDKHSKKIEITFLEPVLGSASGNKELHEEFIAAKADTEGKVAQEMAALPVSEQIEKAMTIFPRNAAGNPIIWDYQFRGFIKAACRVMIELGDCSLNPWNFKTAVDSLVFVNPRQIVILKDGHPITGPLEHLQRSLRAETMQGDRVALANSEMIPAGTVANLEISWFSGSNKKSKLAVFDEDLIKQILDYGAMKGLGQWRSGSYGRFSWKEV